jgi:hypothetical protein
VQRSRFSFLQEAQIWWNRDANQRHRTRPSKT